jgi:hypothetical protein
MPRGGHGEVGVRNPCNGDNCGDNLEDSCSGDDDDEGEENAMVDGRRAMSEWPFKPSQSQDVT